MLLMPLNQAITQSIKATWPIIY